jgi:hypothetical protein
MLQPPSLPLNIYILKPFLEKGITLYLTLRHSTGFMSDTLMRMRHYSVQQRKIIVAQNQIHIISLPQKLIVCIHNGPDSSAFYRVHKKYPFENASLLCATKKNQCCTGSDPHYALPSDVNCSLFFHHPPPKRIIFPHALSNTCWDLIRLSELWANPQFL